MNQRSLTHRLMIVVAVLAVCGIAVSSVSLQHHYARSKTSYCDIGETFNCDIVNRSEYSTLLGIPVALIGMLGYGALAGLATIYRDRPETPALLFGGAVVGLLFALYLTYIEAHVLGSVVHLMPEFAGADRDDDHGCGNHLAAAVHANCT